MRGSCLADALGGGGITYLGVSGIIQKLRHEQECRVCTDVIPHAHVAGDASIAMLLSVVWRRPCSKKTVVGNNLKGVLSAATAAQQVSGLRRLGVNVVSLPVASNYAGAHVPTRMVSDRRAEYTNVKLCLQDPLLTCLLICLEYRTRSRSGTKSCLPMRPTCCTGNLCTWNVTGC